MAFSATGKRVLITGASSGVGAAVARRLAAHGAVVGLIARRRDRLAAVLADCRTTSPDSTMWVVDLGDTAAIGELCRQAWDALGGIDVLINNAGISGPTKSVEDMDPDQWDAAVGVAESSAQRGHDDGHRWPRTPWQSQVRYLLHPL